MDKKVLVGCETSGTVRNAFARLGFNAWSCDVLPADEPSNRHIQDDVREVQNGYECGIAFENYNDIKQGDVIECYEVEEVQREL